MLDVVAQSGFHALELVERQAVVVGELVSLGHPSGKIFVREHNGTVHKVAQNGHQLIVVASLEIAPGEIVVFGLGGIGCEHIAQHILLAGELGQIFMQPHRPVAAGGDFVTLQIQELIGRHILGQLIPAVGHEHGREDEAVEHDVVLADEVDNARVGVFPVTLPGVGQQFLGVADVADGCIEPHIEHFAVGPLNGNRDAPVQVARHGTRLQATVEPRLALAVNVWFPFLVVLKNPFAQGRLPLVERHIPVLGLLEHGHIAGDGAVRIDQVGGVEVAATGLALVAIGALIATVWAGAHDIAVGQPLVGLLVVELLCGSLDEFTLVIEGFEKLGSRLPMDFAGGARVHIE